MIYILASIGIIVIIRYIHVGFVFLRYRNLTLGLIILIIVIPLIISIPFAIEFILKGVLDKNFDVLESITNNSKIIWDQTSKILSKTNY